MKKVLSFVAVLISLSGCYQARDSDDLRAVAVTNNPNILPIKEAASPSPGALSRLAPTVPESLKGDERWEHKLKKDL